MKDWCRSWSVEGWRRATRLLLLSQILGFLFMVAGTHGAFGPMPIPPTTTDFASFYAAGILANRGTPEAAYDPVAHRAVEFEAIAPGVEEKLFLNPPVFLLVCAPLARLPYLVAFALFESVTFLIWLAVCTRVAGGGVSAALALAAIPSVWWALGWGQNSFLSASLLAAGTLLVRRRPLMAGCAYGALCFKPHLAILVPVALIAGGHWRAIVGSAAAAVAFSAISAICFGLPTWRAFLLTALHAQPPADVAAGLAGHIDVSSAARLLGASVRCDHAFQALATITSAICVAWLWRRTRSPYTLDAGRQWRANAGLIAGTLIAAPFLLFYDLVIAGVAGAWLVRHARRYGWRPGEAFILASAMGLNLIAFLVAASLHIPVGILAPMLLLWLCFDAIPERRHATAGRTLAFLHRFVA